MTIGGPLRGIWRAGAHAVAFLKAYLLGGTLLVAIGGMIWGDGEYGNLTFFFVIAHVLASIVVLPAAWAANIVALRVFGLRSWRYQPWRAWVAGVLAVPFIWGGMALVEHPPSAFRGVGRWAQPFFEFGIPVMFSNAAVFVGWLLPPWGENRA